MFTRFFRLCQPVLSRSDAHIAKALAFADAEVQRLTALVVETEALVATKERQLQNARDYQQRLDALVLARDTEIAILKARRHGPVRGERGRFVKATSCA
jgi:hypothetical protein